MPEDRTAAEDAPEEDDGSGLRRAITPTLLLIFIVGDVLGGGIYALVGEVGAETGGAIWSAFILALIMAAFTAGSYAELVSKYPHAGGAALYANRAFKNRFLSFIVAFAVVASGITSASALARGFGGDYLSEFVDLKVVLGALALLALITIVNLRGISESVKINVGFTIVEVCGLLLIVLIAVVAIFDGSADTGRAFEFKEGTSVFAAVLAGATLAFYALVGFEDSVNVAEETQDQAALPEGTVHGARDRRRPLLPGHRRRLRRGPDRRPDRLQRPVARGGQAGPAGVSAKLFSVIGLLAVANGALINMIMASRLFYGMAREEVVPAPLAFVGTARDPLCRDPVHDGDRRRADHHRRSLVAGRHHGGPAGVVFAAVNISVLGCVATPPSTSISASRRSSRCSGLGSRSRS